jgi:HTH-type transcriptional regulator/antitoxin HigA
MEQMGYSQSDLAKVVGLKSRASEILNKKRKLTLEMIRQLHEVLGIPTDVLIQSYQLNGTSANIGCAWQHGLLKKF